MGRSLKWILVKEETPPEHTELLVTDGKNVYQVTYIKNIIPSRYFREFEDEFKISDSFLEVVAPHADPCIVDDIWFCYEDFLWWSYIPTLPLKSNQ